MRILFVNQYYPPDVSATAYLLGELAEGLSEHHEVWVVAGRPSYNPEVGTYRPTGVRVRRGWSTTFPRASLLARAVNYASFVVTSFGRALGVPRPDVVVAMTDPPVIGLVGLLCARLRGARFVYVCQDIFPDVAVALKKIDNPVAVWAWRRLNRVLRNGATRIVAIGRDMVEKLAREGVPAEKVALQPNWGEDYSIGTEGVQALRQSLGWEDRFVVMHAGNVGLAQNLSVLIDAAAGLRRRPEILIAVLGDGAAREQLQRRVADLGLENVQFIPYRPKDEAQALMGAAELHLISLVPGLWGCVVPSKMYGIMAAGRPFIAAVDEGSEPHRVIDEHGCGVRVPPGDPAALAEAIDQLSKESLEAMGQRARAAFLERFQRSMAVDAYRRLLEEAVGHPGSGG